MFTKTYTKLLPMQKMNEDYFLNDVLHIAPGLLGQYLIRKWPDGSTERFVISETEAYRGEEDRGCHCSRGRTPRTEMMYASGGHLYIYLVYGMHYMLNIVAAGTENPQAVLIRGLHEVKGPGRLTRRLQIDKTFHGLHICHTPLMWIEIKQKQADYTTAPRIGIAYAGAYWAGKPWRFILKEL